MMMAVLRQALASIRPYRTWFAIYSLGFLFNLSFELIRPLSLKFLVDYAIVPGHVGNLYGILAALAAGGMISFGAVVVCDHAMIRMSEHIQRDLRMRAFASLQHMPFAFFRKYKTGDVISRFVSDLPAIENLITGLLPTGIYSLVTFAVSAGILLYLEWRAALVALVSLPLFLIGPKLFGGKAEKQSDAYKREADRIVQAIQESVKANPVVRSYNLQRHMTERFGQLLASVYGAGLRARQLQSALRRIPLFTLLSVNFTLIAAGAWFAFRGMISTGDLIAIQAVFLGMANSAYELISIYPALIHASTSLKRTEELLLAEASDGIVRLPFPAQSIAGPLSEIRLDQVSFGYEPGREVVSSVALTVPPKGLIALVGSSGSGKSTILQLMMGFAQPQQGEIRVNGQPLRQLDPYSLRERMGIVFQEHYLFRGTIRDNIAMGKPEATDGDIVEAARLAGIHDFIAGLPDGYHTPIDDDGGTLSGGERQRLALARAIVRKPDLLLLDEVTSALDASTEAAVNETIAALAATCAVVMVTHRLMSVRHADRIYVIDNGTVAEEGTHDELLRRDGIYRRLWNKQTGFAVTPGASAASIEAERLARLPFFTGIADDVLREISRLFVTEHYNDGATVIRQGEQGDKFYMIARGRVEIAKTGQDGEPLRLAVLEDGDHFGEVALLKDVPRNATVTALTPCVVLSLQRVYFDMLISKYPQIKGIVMRSMAERI